MTVCVAAISGSIVLGAADRMLTSGDVEFEPDTRKIWTLTSSIAVMTAGDMALHTEMLEQVIAMVRQRIEESPDEWLRVKDAAVMYSESYAEARRRRAERELLKPLGLDYESFLSRQRNLSSDLVEELARELINYSMPSASAIIAGVDTEFAPHSPHIWVANGSDLTCQDLVGFAAIGAGHWHAQSQFMFAGHTVGNPFPSTALLALTAKKRAEVAPGVGEGTDMFSIGPAPGSYAVMPPQLTERLEEIYFDAREKEAQITSSAMAEAHLYFEELLEKAREGVGRQQPSRPGEAASEEPASKTGES